MPLQEGSSREVVGENIKTEMQHGKPQKQAVAIAMNKAGLSNQDDVKVNDEASTQLESMLPATVTQSEINRRNSEFWGCNGEEIGPSAGGPPLQGM